MLKKSVITLFLLGCLLAVQAQNVNVNGALVGNGSYPTLTAAFAAINGGAQTGTNITISIVLDTYEGTGSATLNAGTWNRITIAPVGAPRTIQGATTPGQALIDLNGADRVLVNGLLAGQKALTIVNTTASGAAGTATVRMANAAQYNRFTDCKILGSSVTLLTDEGGTISFAPSTVPGGNSYNCIRRCVVGPSTAGLPSKAVCGRGDFTVFNVSDSLVDCMVYDYFESGNASAGLRLYSGALDWVVTGNHFYQTVTRTKAGAFPHSDIWIGGGADLAGHVVNGNFLGGTDENGVGMAVYHLPTGATYHPLVLYTGQNTGTNFAAFDTITNIHVNASSNSSSTIPFSAIRAGGRYQIQNNLVGSTDSSGAIRIDILNNSPATLHLINCTGYYLCVCTGNQVGGVDIAAGQGVINFCGIYAAETYSEVLRMSQNQVGFAAAPCMLNGGSANTRVVGIWANADDLICTDNTVAYIESNAPMAGTQYLENMAGLMTGRQQLGIQRCTVRNNRVHSLRSTHPTANVKLVGLYSDAIDSVDRNFVHSLETQSPASQIKGISIFGPDCFVTNNMVQLGIDGAGNSLVQGQRLVGLHHGCWGGTYRHNSVYIGGDSVGGSANTYVVDEELTCFGSNLRKYYNNIFYNARSNGSGTGSHYVFSAATTAPTYTLSDGNLMASPGAGGKFGRFIGGDIPNIYQWRSILGKDLNSISADPRFVQPDGTPLTVDLHIVSPPLGTPIEGAGLGGQTLLKDFDQQVRGSLGPVDIGADAGNFVLEPLPTTPEVDVRGNCHPIANGDTVPSIYDFTYFEIVGCASVPQRTFTISNLGPTVLNLGNFAISGSPAFTLVPPSTSVLTPGQVLSLTVNYSPMVGFPDWATVSFTTNDPDEGNYSFRVEGFAGQDTVGPHAVCQPQTVALGAAGTGALNATTVAAASTDNCGIAASTLSKTQFVCAEIGVESVMLTVVDAAGHADSCNFPVSIIDALAPQAICQGITLPLDANGNAQFVAAVLDGGSTDNCGIDSLWASLGQLSCAQLGPNAVQLHVRDGSGHVSTCTATVTVTDSLAPTALCHPVTLLLNGAGQAQLPPVLLDGGSTDNCAIATRLPSQTQFTCVDVGINPVTLTVTDAAGNVATCSTLVTVLDTVAPVLACANLTVTLPDSGPVVVTPAMVGTATDVCGIASYQLSQTQVACPNVGNSPLQLIAEDVHGNRDSCTVVLTTVTAPLAVVLTTPAATPCGDPIACAGQANVSATASTSGSCTPYTYAWSNGQAGATATGLGAGTHSVTVTSANGQQQVQSILLTAPPALTASIAATPSCPGSNAGSASASGAGGQSCQAYTYLWSNGATSDSVTGLAPGTYQVTVTDAAGCTATASTTVGTWPSFSVTVSQNLGNLVATSGFVTYQWYSSVGAITGATAGQFTPLVSGSYHVVATDSNGCSWTSAAFPFVYVGAAQALPGAWDITLHPNPNTGRFQVLLPWPLQGPVTVKVTDLRGRSVYQETLDLLRSDQVFDLSSVAAGTYLMTIQAQDGSPFRLRFVRE